MDRRPVRRAARGAARWFTAAWIVTAIACAASSTPAGTPPQTTAITLGPTSVWLAVYDTAADPQDLSAERHQMLSALGDALEGAVVISPAGCFDGLPDRVDGHVYVLALQQAERWYVRTLAEQLDGHPRFVAEVTVTCTD
jgi:hypothetical protein